MRNLVLFFTMMLFFTSCADHKAEQIRQQNAAKRQQVLEEYQQKVASTDSAIMANDEALANATALLEQNMLKVKADSLKARYDAYCAIVRKIRMEQEKAEQSSE